MAHCRVYHRLAGARVILTVPAEKTILPEPREGRLYDPAPGQYFEPLGGVAAAQDVQHPLAVTLHPVNQLSRISPISPDQLKSRQPAPGLRQQGPGTVPILYVCGMHPDGQQQSHGVYQNMTLPPTHLLSSIIARGPFFGSFYQLAVYNARSGLCFISAA